jgi:hypothetical protein
MKAAITTSGDGWVPTHSTAALAISLDGGRKLNRTIEHVKVKP